MSVGRTVRNSEKSEAGETRTRLLVNLTEEERTLLEGAARRAGVSMSRYLVDSSVPGRVPDRVSVEEIAQVRDLMLETRRQLVGIATNLNQIAHQANATGQVASEALETARATAKFVDELSLALVKIVAPSRH